ncbi:MAG: DNA-processing protein DprA [Candidatus Eisenbacteria bacterium]
MRGVTSFWIQASSPAFPPRLAQLSHGPSGIWLRTAFDAAVLGAQLWLRPAVAVIGARAASAAGLEIARQLGWDLGRAGVLVVSGLARGIDAAAHEGALLGGGRTVGVLGCGIDCCYPPEHETLAGRIARQGALVSEWPGRTSPLPGRFPRRNRWISGLSDVVVLVEGDPRSGALHTVRYALDDGREVMAVPRDPLAANSQGPNRLLREGAAPVIDASDVLSKLSGVGRHGGGDGSDVDRGSAVPRADAASGVTAGREPEAREVAARGAEVGEPGARAQSVPRDGASSKAVLACLRRGGALSLAELAERLPQEAAGALQAALLSLEVERRAARDRAGRYRLVVDG